MSEPLNRGTGVDLRGLVGVKPEPTQAPKPREISAEAKSIIDQLNTFTGSIPELLKSDIFKHFCQNKLSLGIQHTDIGALKQHIQKQLMTNPDNPKEISKERVVTVSGVMDGNRPTLVINGGIKLQLDKSGLTSILKETGSQPGVSKTPDNSLSRWP